MRPWQTALQAQHPNERSRDIFSYPIFGFFAGGTRRHITGRTTIYLNEQQKARWNFFFRPSLRLINSVDKQKLKAAKAELAALQQLPAIFEELNKLRARQQLFLLLAAMCGAGAVFLFLILGSTWWPVSIILVLAAAGLLFACPFGEIQRLEQEARTASSEVGRIDASIREINDRIAVLTEQIGAIERFRSDIAVQRPKLTLGSKDMESFLNEALSYLEIREKDRLNVYTDDEIRKFGPIVRWALETDRSDTLRSLRPAVNSTARRDSLYARYEIQIIFVHRGQLTVYEGFHDLILGEMMGETRRHIILANLFSVQDQIAQDFDFHRKLQDAILLSDSAAAREEPNAEVGESNLPYVAESLNEENPNRVSITQTRTLRLVGSGDVMELRFVVSEERDTWIAQLQRERQHEEQEIAGLEAMVQQVDDDEDSDSARQLNALEERLLRIRDYEERLRRSEAAQDVEQVVSLILEFTRRAVGQQRADPKALGGF